jgi:hypothetical protein
MRALRLALFALALLVAAPVHAQRFLCPDGKLEKVYDAKANWVASIWDLSSTISDRFYYDVHQDPGLGGQVVFRALARFPISSSTLRNRRVTHAYITFKAARAADVIGESWVVPSLYNGNGLGLDVVKGVTSAQLKQGLLLGFARNGINTFQQLDRNVGPYDAFFENEGIAFLNQALAQRAATFSFGIEPLYRGVPPADAITHAAQFKVPVLTFYHCADVGFQATAQLLDEELEDAPEVGPAELYHALKRALQPR